MQIKQIRLVKMANFCYLVGDEGTKNCALIDPAFETDFFSPPTGDGYRSYKGDLS
ncbi:hypothetical protein D1AOALGA4SA_11547 [Olavius algarvensis Delta 1 endosymbiont]|nr:hypothetical protein D1AOALGA4SA_11547 [Olavius algarvensis Delta 1 endosymbiont]